MRRTWIVAAAGLVLAGCAGGGDFDTPTPRATSEPATATPTPTPTATTTPTPTPTPTPELTKKEKELAAAIAAVEAYLAVGDDLAADPKGDLNDLHDVAFDPAKQQEIDELLEFRQEGLVSEGARILDDPVARHVDGDVQVKGCVDATGLTILTTGGDVWLAPEDREVPRMSWQWLVVYEDDYDGWFVQEDHTVFSDAATASVKPC